MFNNNEQLQFIISAVMMSIVGGIANWLMADKHSVFQFIVAVFLAGFAGFLVGQLCLEAKISEAVSFFLCGSAGLCAEMILKISKKAMLSKFSLMTDQKLDEELDMIEKEYAKRKSLHVSTEDEKESNNLKNFLNK